MFGRRITLFKIFGFAVRLDASWIVIAILVTWSLAGAIFPQAYPHLARATYWWMGAAGAFGLFFGIVVHELCHSLVANHYKLPMRGITLFVFGGVSEMGGEPQSPKVELLMALAGPVASAAIGAIFHGIQLWARGRWSVPVLGVLAYLAWINWILAIFNMIPAFPLDGGRVLRAALWHFKRDLVRSTEVASKIGSGFGILLMAFGLYELFAGGLVAAIWYFLIGVFLRNASRVSYQQVVLREALGGEPVRRFMRPDPVAVSPDLSIRQLVENYFYRYDFQMYPVVESADHLLGCVNTQDVRKVPRKEWDRHRVLEVSRPCSDRNTIGPDTDALNALSKFQETGGASLLVAERDHLLSVISPRDIMNFLAAKLRMQGRQMALPGGSRS
ncbi:MAG TPA: site-2 protease family protein [Bryobacteraceae bacterium]|nr:site-2 protease family protein [Bryobacteraceae bacterium]